MEGLDLIDRIVELEKKVRELTKIVEIMKRDHSFDMGRVFEEIDKITNN